MHANLWPGVDVAIAIGAALLALAWLLDVAFHPWARCLACGGKRTNPGSSVKAWGECKVCGGSGRRLRFGARLVRPDLARRRK